MKPIYFAYIRKSTDSEEKQVMSLESQRLEMQRQFSDDLELEFIEEKKSAFIPNNRPMFDEMLRRLESGEAEGIIAWDPSRLSRNEIDAARITYLLRTGKIKSLKFAAYTFINSPEGIMMLQFALSQSQYESSKKSKDVLRELLQKCERGWFPAAAPNGYLNRWSEEHRESIIEVDELRFPLIKKAFQLVLSKVHTPRAALRILTNEWGYRSHKHGKHGGKELSLSAWYTILKNPFYCGAFSWRGKEYIGKHEPMLTRAEFDMIQAILGSKGKPRPKSYDFAFRGPLRCDSCNYSITADTKRKFIKKRGTVSAYTVYHCTHQSRAMVCPDRVYLGEEKLRDQIQAKILPLSIRALFHEWALACLDELRSEDLKAVRPKDMIAETISDVTSQLKNLVRLRVKNQVSEELYIEEKSELEKTIESLRKRKLDQVENSEDEWFEPTKNTFDYARHATEKLRSGSLEDQRIVLLGLCEQPKLSFGKLVAEPEEWFQPIIEFNTVNREKIDRLEPEIIGSENKIDAELESLRLSWYSVVKEVRTVVEANPNARNKIPKFSEEHQSD